MFMMTLIIPITLEEIALCISITIHIKSKCKIIEIKNL